MTSVKVPVDTTDMWNYCSDAFGIGCWSKMIGFTGTHATYKFENPEDAIAFKIKFGL